MVANETVNTQNAEVFVRLTQEQAALLAEELIARKKHYSGKLGWLRGFYSARIEEANEAEKQRDRVDTLRYIVERASEEARYWVIHGDRINQETKEMRRRGQRLAGAYIGEQSVQGLLAAHLVVLTDMDWLRLWAALRHKMCGLVLVNDEEYAPHSGAEPSLSLIFPVRFRELFRRVGRVLSSPDLTGNEVVLVLDRRGLHWLVKAVRRACRSAVGRAGFYGSRYNADTEKHAAAKSEADYLKEALAALESVRLEPYTVPMEENPGE